MIRLLHHQLDPASRLIRLMCAEYGVALELDQVIPWKREPQFTAVSPAATLPVLIGAGTEPVVGPLACIQHIEQQHAPASVAGLVPGDPAANAEMWRLLEWTMFKLNEEVTRYVLEEKLGKRARGEGTPDVSALRAAMANLSEHLLYFDWLLASRTWVGGEEMTLADFALAAHLSSLDYLGDVDWAGAGEARDWYARMKSRPTFRPLLSDRLVGMPPSSSYADLDF
ncbi:MAG TPA: glutathione S-transferase family protein [Devosia sp.]|nr:glutathione S-transferase family protein [Devosia sp.]